MKSTKGDLSIYKYSQECQYKREWNKYTIASRGLILDKDGLVISKPFDKFFNLEETINTKIENLPKEPYVIQDKLDGSCLQIYHHEGRWNTATLGSFNNIYTEFADSILPDLSEFPKHVTICCEVCLPPDIDTMKRVVSHEPGLYYLASFDKYTGKELDLRNLWKGNKVSIFENLSISELVSRQKSSDGTEGWVVRFDGGLRVKIKTLWYLQIFRYINNFKESDIRILLKEYGIDNNDWLVGIPEELLPEIKEIISDIRVRYWDKYRQIKENYDKIKDLPTRKDFAIKAKDLPNTWAYFNLYDNRTEWETNLIDYV